MQVLHCFVARFLRAGGCTSVVQGMNVQDIQHFFKNAGTESRDRPQKQVCEVGQIKPEATGRLHTDSWRRPVGEGIFHSGIQTQGSVVNGREEGFSSKGN